MCCIQSGGDLRSILRFCFTHLLQSGLLSVALSRSIVHLRTSAWPAISTLRLVVDDLELPLPSWPSRKAISASTPVNLRAGTRSSASRCCWRYCPARATCVVVVNFDATVEAVERGGDKSGESWLSSMINECSEVIFGARQREISQMRSPSQVCRRSKTPPACGQASAQTQS